MLNDGIDREIAGEFAVCFAAHSIGNYIQAERGLDAIGVFVIVPDAPDICTRSYFNLHSVSSD
jgi:hypothetical protein